MTDLQYFYYISSTQFNVYRVRGVSLTNSLILILVLFSLLDFDILSLAKSNTLFLLVFYFDFSAYALVKSCWYHKCRRKHIQNKEFSMQYNYILPARKKKKTLAEKKKTDTPRTRYCGRHQIGKIFIKKTFNFQSIFFLTSVAALSAIFQTKRIV